MAQVSWGGGGCSIPRNNQGQVGQVSELPGRVEDVPADGRGLGLQDL